MKSWELNRIAMIRELEEEISMNGYDRTQLADKLCFLGKIDMDFENPMNTALAGIQATEDYFASLDMPVTLKQLDVSPEVLEEMAHKCTFFGKRTLAGRKELGEADILAIYKAAMGE